MRRTAVVGLVLAVVVGCSDGWSPDGRKGSDAVIVSIAEVPARAIRPGGSATVVVRLRIAEGYHVQANPAANEFLIPLELAIDSDGGLTLGDPAYPPPRRHRLAGADADLLTYDGETEIALPVAAPEEIAPGKTLLEGEVRYQACDARTCYFPASLRVAFEIDVTG